MYKESLDDKKFIIILLFRALKPIFNKKYFITFNIII